MTTECRYCDEPADDHTHDPTDGTVLCDVAVTNQYQPEEYA